MRKFFKAYSLVEVVVAMMVIATIVGVSIKATKTKMDSIISYTYYIAYETLRESVSHINNNFKSTEEIYLSENSIMSGVPSIGDCGGESGKAYKEDDSCYELSGRPQTLPRNGFNFCLKMFERVNLSGSFAENRSCMGHAIDHANPIFTDRAPDLVLSNGIRFYNLSQNPVEIEDLKANDDGMILNEKKFKLTNEGTLYNTKTFGYIVYIDIDGIASGSNTIWDDIYKFYITLDGFVIPAWNDLDGGIGAKSRSYLEVSVMQIEGEEDTPTKWVKKSVSFQEAACASGNIALNTDYCGGISIDSECDPDSSKKCELRTIKPIKLFGLL